MESITTIVSPVNWVNSIRNRLADRGAPAALVPFFTLRSPLALGVFTVVDRVFQAFGHGAMLRAELRAVAVDRARPAGRCDPCRRPAWRGLHRRPSMDRVRRRMHNAPDSRLRTTTPRAGTPARGAPGPTAVVTRGGRRSDEERTLA